MKPTNVIRLLCLAAMLLSAGCGLFHKRKEVYLEAEQGHSLVVPPDLDSPSRRDAMRVGEAPAVSTTISA